MSRRKDVQRFFRNNNLHRILFQFIWIGSIFKRIKSLRDQHPHVVFDSNKIQHDIVIEHEYSPNGKYCAFTISDNNKISMEVIVINTDTGEPHGNCLQLFSFEKIAWSGNSEGFFVYVSIHAFYRFEKH